MIQIKLPITNTKLCSNCKHRIEPAFGKRLGKCKQFGKELLCISLRAKDGPCGPEGKGYEPRI